MEENPPPFFIFVGVKRFYNKKKEITNHEFLVYPMLAEVVTAVDRATNNKQLFDLKSSKLDQKTMKSYNRVKIMSIVLLSLCQARNFTLYPHTYPFFFMLKLDSYQGKTF